MQIQLSDARDLLADALRQFQEEVARCNSNWVDLRGFASPKTHNDAAMDEWMGGWGCAGLGSGGGRLVAAAGGDGWGRSKRLLPS